jgi:hypothetical protein
MRVAGIVIGLLAAASGAVWLLQGLNASFAPQSFMTDDRGWVWLGGLAVVGGLALAGWSWRGGKS